MFKMFKLQPKEDTKRAWRIEDTVDNFVVEFMGSATEADKLYTHLRANNPEGTRIYCGF